MSSEQERQSKYETVYVTPEYKQQLKQAAEIAKAKKEAEQLKALDLITEAHEGYYYKAEDVEAYNKQAIEYNKKLREYKLQLSRAEMDSKLGALNLEQYESQRKLYLVELERTAPDRAAFLEYVKGIGPPELTEDQKRRQAEGLPVIGIPGPAAGPKPGSVGERIQAVIGPPLIKAVEAIEAPYRMVTQPLRGTAAELEERSLESSRKGDAVIGFSEYVAAKGLKVGAAAFDVATYEFRPQLWADVGRTVGGLVFDPSTQEQVAEYVTKDPFGAATELAGGAYFGGRLIEFTEELGAIPGKIKALPGKYRRFQAKRNWAKYGDEELFRTGEYELNLQFPEPDITYETTSQLFKRKTLIIYDRAGLVKERIPYYIETIPELEKITQNIVDAADDWSPKKIGSKLDSYYALAFDEKGGAILVKGKTGMKPFKEPTASIAPRREQITVYSEKAAPTTPITSMFQKADRLLESVIVEPIYGYVEPMRFAETITVPTIRAPSFKVFEALALVPRFRVQEFSDTAIINKLKSFEAGAEKSFKKFTLTEKNIPDFTLKQVTKLEATPIQSPDVDLKLGILQLPKQAIAQIEVQILKEPELTMPPIKIPPFYGQPTYKPKPKLEVEKKKKKKKGRRGRKEAWELRADKILKFEFKEPKIKL